jgi:hypothetical protein
MKSEHFLKEGFVEDASEVHADHEVQMARSDLFHAAEDALVLHKLLRNVSEQQGLEGWVAAKITLASDYLKTVREYIEYELMTAASEQPMLPIAEGSGSKEKQKTPYRDINSPEYRTAAEKQKEKMDKEKAAEPGKKLLGKIEKQEVEEAANDYFKRRKDEEDRIADTKAPAKRTPQQTDYARRRAQEKKTEQGMAEGLPQTLRKVVPGYAKREIDKKMDAGKFGKTDADKDANFQRYKKIQDKIKEQGVAEGLNEFAPDGFNGGDDDEGFSPEIAKMAQEDGFTKGVSLADGATLERAMTINHWHSQHGGMYKQYFAKGFKQGRMNKVKHDNRQYNLNLKLMKDGSIRHGEQGVAEGLPQTLRKVVPGYAKREIDKKMDAGKFGKTDADKDANFQRYKKIQDKIKEGDKKPHPKTWHDVDPKLGKQVDKMSQAEKVKKGLAHPDTLKKKGVAEGQADQVKKIVKKNGKPVGEIGTDPEASPGNGNWYVKHYASGYDVVGFDNAEEALAELKHCMKQGVAEGVTRSFDLQLIEILKQRGFKGPMAVGRAKKWIPAVKEVAANGNFSIGADDIMMVSGTDPDYDPWVLYVPKVGKYIYNEGMAYNLLTAKQVVKFTVPTDDKDFYEGVAEDDSALQAFLSKGGKIQQLPYKKPRKADKTDYGSKHIGGSGDKMKASRTGTAAKTQGNKVAGMAEEQVTETSAGSVAGVVNPTPKNKAKVGTLFGGTYKQKKSK